MSGAPPRAAVVGGSLAGLAAAVVLRHAGYQVDVYEQSSGQLSSSGAGIVLQPEVELLLERYVGIDPARIATSCRERQYLAADGSAQVSLAMPQRFTAWNALYRELRMAVPDASHHTARRVASVSDGESAATVTFDDGAVIEAELVVAADGWRSVAREALQPGIRPQYAGYVAWRGVAQESQVTDDVLDQFRDRFTFYETPQGGHALCYLVPGVNGELEPGSRRLNWVWYANVDEGPDLDFQLTDRAGIRRPLGTSPGSASAAFVEQLHDTAQQELPPAFRALVTATAEPFVQAIVDLESPRMAWKRCCVIGDAAFVPRPHTAASTAKAAGDALSLGQAVARAGSGREPEALRAWEPARLATGRQLAAHGQQLGLRSQADKRTTRR